MLSTDKQTWPSRVWLVRHGESAGNVARDAAIASGAARIDIEARDVDVPLSPRGELQAAALGRWVAAHPEQPTVVLSSPYTRAVQTAAAMLPRTELHRDERLREKELGALDRLTRAGIEAQFPQETEARTRLGKFYYRPPSGESWCDVIQRLRGVLVELQHAYPGERVAIVGHQVIVLCFRYLLERMTEAQILAVDKLGDVANCAVTTYEYDRVRDRLALESYNVVPPGVPVTKSPDPAAKP